MGDLRSQTAWGWLHEINNALSPGPRASQVEEPSSTIPVVYPIRAGNGQDGIFNFSTAGNSPLAVRDPIRPNKDSWLRLHFFSLLSRMALTFLPRSCFPHDVLAVSAQLRAD
jgi:hypothetical protein